MSAEFHYPANDWQQLKMRLPERWLPINDALSMRQPTEITEGEWDEIDLINGIGPQAIFVSVCADRRKVIANKSIRGVICVDCRELFLETMRPELCYVKAHNDEGAFVPPGAREDLLEQCGKKFSNLLHFVIELPGHIRRELNHGLYELGMSNLDKIKRLESRTDQLSEQEIEELQVCKDFADSKPLNIDDLEGLLSKLASASQLKHRSIDKEVEVFGRNFYRGIFLNKMLRIYRMVYEELPVHTYDRKTSSKNRRFIGVAMKMCKLVGYSNKHLETELGYVKRALSFRSSPEKS